MSIAEQYAEELYNNTDITACLDAVMEAEEAVDIINKDMFSSIADICIRYLSHTPASTAGDVKAMLKIFEKKYKRAKSIRTMPGSYRSAKSVIINAIQHDLYLHYEDGLPKTKTWLEKELRQAKQGSGTKKADTPNNVVYKARKELELLVGSKLSDDKSLGGNLEMIEDLCQHIREKYL